MWNEKNELRRRDLEVLYNWVQRIRSRGEEMIDDDELLNKLLERGFLFNTTCSRYLKTYLIH